MILPAPLWLGLLASLAGCGPAAEGRSTGAGGGAGGGAVGSELSSPALVCERREVDFGVVDQGQILEHEFELEVRADVTVSSAKTDCGCTLPRLERLGGAAPEPYEFGSPLVAGERLRLHVRYDTLGKEGPTSRAVTLACEPEGFFPVHVAADVRPWLEAEPRQFEFVRLLEGQSLELPFRVRSRAGQPFGLSATGRAIPPSVQVELTPEGDTSPAAGPVRAAAWRGVVRLTPEVPLGTHGYPIELESDVLLAGPPPGPDLPPRHQAVSPLLSVQIVGPVALSRPSLDFGLVRPELTVSQVLRLDCYEPGFDLKAPSVHLEPLRPEDPFPLGRTATVHVREAPPGPPGQARGGAVGRSWDLELVLAGLDAEVNGSFLARLVVETGHPRFPRLEALVRGVKGPGSGRSGPP